MAGPDREPVDDFNWQSYFQDATEPLFLLSRRRRILFVNHAWETATGRSASQVKGLLCSRRRQTDASSADNLAHTLCPPPGVLQGRSVRVRRAIPAGESVSGFWDLAYSPVQGPDGVVGVLGRIQAVSREK